MSEPAPPGASFADLFGRAPEVRAHAPGRVNLIGEHTDYNGGFVLPTAIPQETTIELARRDDGRVRAASAERLEGGVLTFVLGEERRGGLWIDYLQGVTDVLRRDGVVLGGFDVRVSSRVPLGAGLSSSAALEVALLRALREAFDFALGDVALALAAQRVETEFVGAPVGVMDQMASSLAVPGMALFLDTRTLSFRLVPLPTGADLAVIDSGVKHSHATGEYRIRRGECERAAAELGVPELRDLPDSGLARVEALPEPLRRRARHVVTENRRVLDAVAAIESGDVARLGELFYASHRSMRDDYQVSTPEIDALVEIAAADEAVLGARLTGGGFGGSIVVLTRRGQGRAVAERIVAAGRARTGTPVTALVPEEDAAVHGG